MSRLDQQFIKLLNSTSNQNFIYFIILLIWLILMIYLFNFVEILLLLLLLLLYFDNSHPYLARITTVSVTESLGHARPRRYAGCCLEILSRFQNTDFCILLVKRIPDNSTQLECVFFSLAYERRGKFLRDKFKTKQEEKVNRNDKQSGCNWCDMSGHE